MTEQSTSELLLGRLPSVLALTDEERTDALSLIRFYLYNPAGYWPWGEGHTGLTDRQRRIDEAVVTAISAEFRLDARHARAAFDTTRITAARMRISTTIAPPRRGQGRVRSKKGRRG